MFKLKYFSQKIYIDFSSIFDFVVNYDFIRDNYRDRNYLNDNRDRYYINYRIY